MMHQNLPRADVRMRSEYLYWNCHESFQVLMNTYKCARLGLHAQVEWGHQLAIYVHIHTYHC